MSFDDLFQQHPVVASFLATALSWASALYSHRFHRRRDITTVGIVLPAVLWAGFAAAVLFFGVKPR